MDGKEKKLQEEQGSERDIVQLKEFYCKYIKRKILKRRKVKCSFS